MMTDNGLVRTGPQRPPDHKTAIGARIATSCWIVAVLLVLGAAYLARPVIAPIAMALFLIALVWPLQSWLQLRLPRQVALLISLLATLSTVAALGALLVWGFGGVARWTFDNMGRLQALYDQAAGWLESQGAPLSGLSLAHLNVGWLLGVLQRITGQVNTTATFWLVVCVYLILGLIEVDGAARRIRALPNPESANFLLQGTVKTAAKLRKFMLVRTLMSVATGVAVCGMALLFGLPLAREWGLIAFALNYLPVIGPLLATLFPTCLAVVQLESWKAVVALFASLATMQFLIGNYVEPRLSGSALSMSPFIVLASIFLWTWLWGLTGTFLGVPITITVLTFSGESASARWLAILLGPDTRSDPGQSRARAHDASLKHNVSAAAPKGRPPR